MEYSRTEDEGLYIQHAADVHKVLGIKKSGSNFSLKITSKQKYLIQSLGNVSLT